MRRLLLCITVAGLLLGQSGAPALDPAFARDTYVTGRARVGSGPIVAFDISYPAPARLGEGPVDKNGKFAISVDPPLKSGNRIIVENKAKTKSAAIMVRPPRPGPAPR